VQENKNSVQINRKKIYFEPFNIKTKLAHLLCMKFIESDNIWIMFGSKINNLLACHTLQV
jgi:hypothetical protein